MSAPLLEVQDLTLDFVGSGRPVRALDSVSFELAPGEKLALVGESGSGKTVTALSVLQLNHDVRVSGRVLFEGRDLLALGERQMRAVRGREIAMIFQEPMTALNPLYPVGRQIAETLELHEAMTSAQARSRAIELLELTGIAEPERRVESFPHQLSGGQRQRAMIAMALACRPRLLIADEPTTALDVTVQRQIIELLEQLQREFGMSVLLISHDLPLVRRFCDRVAVMKSGRVVETGAAQTLFESPREPYTRKLIDSRPKRRLEPVPPHSQTLLEASGVGCRYWFKTGWFSRKPFDAVDGVDLSLRAGETLGIVGESGSGKTSLGMSLLRLAAGNPSGSIRFDGHRLDGVSQGQLRPLRRRMQVVFQDPFNSLSPRMTVEGIVGEGLALHHPELKAPQRRERIVALLEEVGLDAGALSRYPHEFSGGQRQRIAIARALILSPALLLLDEPTSALDVSVQQQVLELLRALQVKYGLAYLFITHDLAVIRAMAHRVIVMREGRVVESNETLALFETPQHPYTQTLLAALQD